MIRVRRTSESQFVIDKLDSLISLTQRGMRQAWFKTGKDLMTESNKQILKKPKSGRIYRVRTRSGRFKRHRSSAPGQSHANLSGKLRRSRGWKVKGSTQLEFGYGVTKKAPDYAEPVEKGSRNMSARPTLLNTINASTRNIVVNFEESIFKAHK